MYIMFNTSLLMTISYGTLRIFAVGDALFLVKMIYCYRLIGKHARMRACHWIETIMFKFAPLCKKPITCGT